jgi:hypothetical protein
MPTALGGHVKRPRAGASVPRRRNDQRGALANVRYNGRRFRTEALEGVALMLPVLKEPL